MKSQRLTSPKHIGMTFDQDSSPYSALMCAMTYQAVEDMRKWTYNMTDTDKKSALLWLLKVGDMYGYQKKTVYEHMKKKCNLDDEKLAFYDKVMESEVK